MVTKITMQEMIEILDETEASTEQDFGDVIVHQGNHPKKGDYTIINTLNGNCILVQ